MYCSLEQTALNCGPNKQTYFLPNLLHKPMSLPRHKLHSPELSAYAASIMAFTASFKVPWLLDDSCNHALHGYVC